MASTSRWRLVLNTTIATLACAAIQASNMSQPHAGAPDAGRCLLRSSGGGSAAAQHATISQFQHAALGCIPVNLKNMPFGLGSSDSGGTGLASLGGMGDPGHGVAIESGCCRSTLPAVAGCQGRG